MTSGAHSHNGHLWNPKPQGGSGYMPSVNGCIPQTSLSVGKRAPGMIGGQGTVAVLATQSGPCLLRVEAPEIVQGGIKGGSFSEEEVNSGKKKKKERNGMQEINGEPCDGARGRGAIYSASGQP